MALGIALPEIPVRPPLRRAFIGGAKRAAFHGGHGAGSDPRMPVFFVAAKAGQTPAGSGGERLRRAAERLRGDLAGRG